MFFDQQNFSARMLTATKLSWERQKLNVQMRAYDSLSLRLVGNGTIVLGGSTYTVKAGDVMYLPAGYGYEADYSATEMIAIHFYGNFDVRPGEIEIFDCSDKVLSLFEKAAALYDEKPDGFKLSATAVFYEILAALSSAPDKTDEILLHALAYISENYGDPEMKLSDICRAVGTSESSLRRRFYDRYGVSPVDYIIEYRLDRACDLLSARNATVAETAEKCGFSEPKYLSRIMKKRRGFSPSSLKIKVL